MTDQGAGPGAVRTPSARDAGARPLLVVGVLALAVTAFGLITSLTFPALPHLQREFDTDQATITWVVTAYLASSAVLTPVLGRVGDVVGRERLLIGCLVVLTAGSLLAALAPSVEVLILARVVQGAGGGVLPLSYAIVREHVPADRGPAAVGLISSLMGVSSAVGIVIGGPIIDSLGYEYLFWIPLAATAIAATVAVVVIPRRQGRTGEPVPFVAAGLFGIGMVSGLIALNQSARWGWLSAEVLGLLLLCVLGFAGQWAIDRRRPATAFMDLALLRRRAVAVGHVVGFLVGFGMYASFAFVAPMLQAPVSGHGFGASTSVAGLLMLPCAVASFAGGIVAPHLARPLGTRPLIVVACAVAALGMAGIALSSGSRTTFVVSYTVLGLGLGVAIVCLTNHLLDTVPSSQLAAVAGMNANLRVVGGAVGTALLAAVVTASAASGDPYLAGFLVLAGGLVVAALAATGLPRPAIASEQSDTTNDRITLEI
ncbi:MFS transporter [Nocardioides marmoriginsengisoli]|uniref:MFS transporter n=1 Tax=Nocardioides marmoriginsengisoli TaxID=661483 RepID=A0A3N0CHK8_9ACTN|nr:MFS transporter [Nocardioides marmoriginsengisoli]RNL62506.1 MFS transporter [Nocardioides marmoriginsengisoli]